MIISDQFVYEQIHRIKSFNYHVLWLFIYYDMRKVNSSAFLIPFQYRLFYQPPFVNDDFPTFLCGNQQHHYHSWDQEWWTDELYLCVATLDATTWFLVVFGWLSLARIASNEARPWLYSYTSTYHLSRTQHVCLFGDHIMAIFHAKWQSGQTTRLACVPASHTAWCQDQEI